MEKEAATVYRRHRPGPGAPPLGVAAGHLKGTSEGADLPRSRSMCGLHQKGDPLSCLQKPSKEPEQESEDQGKDPKSDDAEDTTCRAGLEAEEQGQTRDARGEQGSDSGTSELEVGRNDTDDGDQREQEEEEVTDEGPQEAQEQESESIDLEDLLEKGKPSMFVEIDLEDPAEEVLTCASAMREEKLSQINVGDFSEDEMGTSWVCCIPYSTRKKVKESA